jgi:Replication initiator protein, pSAM2
MNNVPTIPADVKNQTRAERMRQPLALDVARAAAEQHGVCVRPFTMEVGDPDTGELRYIGVPCGSTIESVCKPCAKKAQALRMTQCREGWHMAEEPNFTPEPPTGDQKELLAYRATLVKAYAEANEAGEDTDELREEIHRTDEELRQLGVRGRLPSPDAQVTKLPKRSTKRRQDAPDLPRRKVANTTVGREYAGKFRPSMFVTLTLDSYGRVREDGTPVDPTNYDYRRAARDAVHFSSLVDRWWQNLRRVVGWDVQYFATVEPQKRAAPHLHAALRGSIPHEVLRMVTAATYHQVWWPNHDEMVYGGDRLPVWDNKKKVFVDPDTNQPLTEWADAVEQVDEPVHVVTFGRQVHSKGILGGTDEAGRHIGYLTKYLTKATGEVIEAATARQQQHHERLHEELTVTPCSPRCPVWLLYGIQPLGVTSRTVPGHCKGRAHRRTTLALPGRRVLVSRKWSGKTLADHKADRKAFVTQALAAVGIEKPVTDTSRLVWRKVEPGDRNAPPRAHLLMHAIAERIRWRAEYDSALLSATQEAA